MSKQIIFSLHEPRYGWLPVDLYFDNFKIDFEAADVPINPLELLCDALIDLSVKGKTEIFWYQEPGAIFFELTKIDNDYTLTISEADDYDAEKKVQKIITGNFETVIAPLKNTTLEFYSKTYDENNWPSLDKEKLTILYKLSADT